MISFRSSSWSRRIGTCLVRVWVRKGFMFDRGSGSYKWLSRAQLVGLILTSTYFTKRLIEEERERKRDLDGGRAALPIYLGSRRLTHLPTLSASSTFSTGPPSASTFADSSCLPPPTTDFYCLHPLLPPSATFYCLLPSSATLGAHGP